jgi:hypothetical protein
MTTYYESVPHVPDELSYLHQAKIFASGRLAAPVPVSPDSFQFFFPSFDVVEDGKWASIYPFGHPLVLTPGIVLGVPWLMPPLLGAAAVALLFFLGREVYSSRTGIAAATLFTVSPFFMMTASNFMSHNTATLLLLAALVSIQRANRRPLLYTVLCGIFLGLLFNTRPLTGLAAAIPIGVFILFGLLKDRRGRRDALLRIGGLSCGAALMMLCYFGYEYGASGDLLSLAQNQAGGDSLGFSGQHSLAKGLSNEQTQLSLLVLVAHNWPLEIGLILVALPFLAVTRNRWDWLLGGLVLSLAGAYTLYALDGIMHGPRFWYETLPILMLLSVRGVESLVALLAALTAMLRSLATEERARLESAARGLALTAIVLLGAYGGYDWLFGNGGGWRVDFMPHQAEALTDFNGLRPEFAEKIASAELENALVLVEKCGNWQCYGSVYLENNVTLDSNVVFARNLENLNRDLLLSYPDRRVYAADYGKLTLTPYGGQASAPLARDVAHDFPVAKVTPEPASAPPELVQARDQQRKDDLNRIAEALRQLYDATGAIPEVKGVQSLCVYGADAGCAVKQVLDPLPKDPLPDRTYWYSGEGQSFVLYASLEEDLGEPCSEVPAHLAREENVFCVKGRVSMENVSH